MRRRIINVNELGAFGFEKCTCTNTNCNKTFRVNTDRKCPPLCPACVMETWPEDDEGAPNRSVFDRRIMK